MGALSGTGIGKLALWRPFHKESGDGQRKDKVAWTLV